jgi:hypothetical protein
MAMSLYPAPPPDALTTLGMVAITAVVVPAAAWVFAAGQRRAAALWLAAGAGVLTLSATLAATGLLARVAIQPPLLQSLIVLLLTLLLWRGVSRRGRQAAAAMSLPALVLLQSFRLPLEVLMLHAANVGVMPVEFSMVGYNFDVVTGALALPLGLALRRGWRVPSALIWGWNLWGIACLGVIVVLAVLTSPNVAYFGRQTAHLSIWVLHFPYVWLPTVLVGVAIFGHLALSIRLQHQPTAAPAAATPVQPPQPAVTST